MKTNFLTWTAAVLALLVITTFVWAISAQENDPRAEDITGILAPAVIQKIRDAAAIFQAGQPAAALEQLKQISKENPQAPPAHLFMAQWYSDINDITKTKQSLEQCIKEWPKDPEAYLVFANILIRQGDLTAAGLMIDKSRPLLNKSKTNPKRKSVLETRLTREKALLASALKDWKQAQTQLEKLLELNPDSAIVKMDLGRVLFHRKKYDAAEKMFASAVKNSDETVPVKTIMARLYMQSGENKKAAQAIYAALQENPKSAPSLVLATQINIATHNYDKAQTRANQLLSLSPEDAQALKLAATVALFRKDYKGAQAFFEKVTNKSPLDFEAVNGLILSLCEDPTQKNLKRAAEYAATNVRNHPETPQATATLGWVLYKVGDMDKAAKVLNAAAKKGNVSAATAYFMACVAIANAETDQAEKLLTSALGSTAPFIHRDTAQTLLNQLKTK